MIITKKEIEREYLQHQEEKEVKVSPNEQKNITHRDGGFIIISLQMDTYHNA